MSPQELEKEIRGWIERFVSRYPQGAERIWRMPLVGFADANSPYLQRLPELVMPGHRLPQDYLEQATVVISYFVPFTKAHGDQNLKGENDLASPSWAQSYLETNRMIEALNLALAEEIRRLGYHAVVPYGIGMDETLLKSPWSQRHIAYAAGLGTFGINHMLITDSGCCGRLGSVVADLPIAPGEILREERCLYLRSGGCKRCTAHCFSGALTADGFDRQKCYQMTCRNLEAYGADCCGKCDVGLPCSYRDPTK